MNNYKAFIVYKDNGSSGERSLDIIFEAESNSEAVRAAVRFWKNRHKILPGVFSRLYCIKVYPYTIGRIDTNGALGNRLGWHIFEYKCDTAGLPLDDYVEWRCSDMERSGG